MSYSTVSRQRQHLDFLSGILQHSANAGRYADDENAVMRKACKLLNVGVTRLESEIVQEPFFDHVIGAAAEKIAFRYLAGLIHRCTEGSGGKMISEEVGARACTARKWPREQDNYRGKKFTICS